MATVYKSFTTSDINDRNIRTLTADEKLKVSNVLTNFITYFKNKHLP